MSRNLWWHFVTGGETDRRFATEIIVTAADLGIIETVWALRLIGDSNEEEGVRLLQRLFTPQELPRVTERFDTEDERFLDIRITDWRWFLSRMRMDVLLEMLDLLATKIDICPFNADLDEALRAEDVENTPTITRGLGAPRMPRFDVGAIAGVKIVEVK